jgi:hypothetical protein
MRRSNKSYLAKLMDSTFFANVSSMRLFGGIEITNVFDATIEADARFPFSLVFGNTKVSGRIGDVRSSSILHVLFPRRGSQIRESIVGLFQIAMVYLVWWPFCGDVEPCESVCGVKHAVDNNRDVPVSGLLSSDHSDASPSALIDKPNKLARIGIVRQQFLEPIKRNSRLIQLILLSRSLLSLPSFMRRWSRTTSMRAGTRITSATKGLISIASAKVMGQA